MIYDFQDTNNDSGLGASISAIVAGGGQIAAGVIPGIMAAGVTSVAAGGTGLLLGMAPALAVPVIGAAIAGVTLAVSLFLNRNAQYFGEEKATTQIVNQAETLMKQNLSAWQSLVAEDKTVANQQQALANFNTIWGQVVQACGSPAFSQGHDSTGQSPGTRCVTDRQRGGRWDWFSYYFDPIANDPIYTPPTPLATVTGDVSSILTSAGETFKSFLPSPDSSMGMLLPVLAIGAGLLLVFGGRGD